MKAEGRELSHSQPASSADGTGATMVQGRAGGAQLEPAKSQRAGHRASIRVEFWHHRLETSGSAAPARGGDRKGGARQAPARAQRASGSKGGGGGAHPQEAFARFAPPASPRTAARMVPAKTVTGWAPAGLRCSPAFHRLCGCDERGRSKPRAVEPPSILATPAASTLPPRARR